VRTVRSTWLNSAIGECLRRRAPCSKAWDATDAAGVVAARLIFFERKATCANDQSAGSQRTRSRPEQDEEPGAAEQPAKARRLRARLHPDAQEAELGAAQGRARPADQRDRGDDLHSRRRPQPAGTLARAHPRRPSQGPPGRPLSRRPRHARRRGRRGPHAGPIEIRREEAEEVRDVPASS